MVSFEHEGVEIDRCLECGGTWLDAGELELLTELSGVEPGGLSRALQEATPVRRGRRRCPRCRRRLQLIEVESHIELDRCRRGDGLWLDRGEMEAVVLSFAEGEEGAVARFFADLYRSDLAIQPEGD